MSTFLRVKLLEAKITRNPPSDSFCAVNIKDVQQTPEGMKFVQKKNTFYPNWGKCFDSHVVSGRRVQVKSIDRGRERER